MVRPVVALAALLLSLITGCGGSDRPADVVVIVIDTLRQDRLGYAGYPRPVSPRIDAFAQESVAFLRARAVAAWTKPTVTSILTGSTPQRHGVLRYNERLRSFPTLATRLRLAGHRTRAVVANPFLSQTGIERGFQTFENLSDGRGWHIPGDEVTDAALAAVPDDGPMLLYVHYLDPHDPYQPSAEAAAELVRPYDGPANGSIPFIRFQLLAGEYTPTPDDVAHVSDLYDAEIRTADAAVGRLLDGLRERGRYDDAWIVLTSDHGEELYEHGHWLHSYTLYEHQLAIPLIVKPPRRLGIAPGTRFAPVSQIDVVPTLLEGLGLPPDPAVERPEGRSLLARMRDGDAGGDDDRVLFAEQGFGSKDGRTGMGFSARQADLKWIELEGEYPHQPRPPEGECYDLATDPGEQRNLAGGAAHPCAALAGQVQAWRRQERAEAEVLDLPEETEAQLRALGYTP